MACAKGTLVLFGRMKELLFSVGLKEEESADGIFPEMAQARLFLEGFSPAAATERYRSAGEAATGWATGWAMGWATGEAVEDAALLAVKLTGTLFRGRGKGVFSDELERKQKDSGCWDGLCQASERRHSRVLLNRYGRECRQQELLWPARTPAVPELHREPGQKK